MKFGNNCRDAEKQSQNNWKNKPTIAKQIAKLIT